MKHWQGRLLLVGTVLFVFFPVLFLGEVLYPHDNSVEVGLPETTTPDRLSTRRKFSDQSSFYLPVLHQQLNGAASGWITTWNPHVELGRPARQIFGFGKSYFLTHALSWFSTDTFRVYSWLAIAAVLLTGVFGYLLLEVLGLSPPASLTGALGLCLGVFPAYTLSFVLFIWGVCWTLAILLFVTLFLRRPTVARGFGVAVAAHALLLSSYPQHIVWMGYLLTGYTLLGLARTTGGRRRIVLGAQLAGCVALGVLSAAPAYLDLALTASRSGRVAVAPEFFLKPLPELVRLADVGVLWTTLFDGFWFGNLVRPDYPTRFTGLSITPVYAVLLAFSLTGARWKRLWPVHAFAGVTLLLTIWPAAYLFAVDHLGLGFSRSVPIRLAHIPLVVASAFAAHDLVRGGARKPWAATGLSIALVLAAVLGALASGFELHRGMVAAGLAFAAGGVAFLWTRSATLLVVLVIAGVFHYGFRQQLRRDHDEIAVDSPLVELIRSETTDGSRFAWVGTGVGAMSESGRLRSLPPNQEVLFGLRSIHTYNSLSSGPFHHWAVRFNKNQVRKNYGRRFTSVRAIKAFWEEGLAQSAVSVLLSEDPLDPAHAEDIATFQTFRAYRARAAPVLEAQLVDFARVDDGHVRLRNGLEERLSGTERSADEGDRLEFTLRPAQEQSLLFISQQHHPRWRTIDEEQEVVMVDDFYLGVLLPPGSSRVELRFEPRVRWSWIPQLLFALGGLVIGVRASMRRARPRSAGR